MLRIFIGSLLVASIFTKQYTKPRPIEDYDAEGPFYQHLHGPPPPGQMNLQPGMGYGYDEMPPPPQPAEFYHGRFENPMLPPPQYGDEMDPFAAMEEEQRKFEESLIRPMRPSEALETGFIPADILQFRSLYNSLREKYLGFPLLDNEEYASDSSEEERDGRLIDFGLYRSLFGDSHSKSTPVDVGASFNYAGLFPAILNPSDGLTKQADFVQLPGIQPCSNNDAICQSSETCVNTGGTPIGQCSKCLQCDVCCKYVFEDQATCEVPIAFFQSPNYPEMCNDDHATSLSITIRNDVDQILLEFINFEMPIGPDGCHETDYLEIIIPTKSDDLLGPGNSKFCGVNTDQHIYLDVSPGDLVVLKTLSSSKNFRFKIKITQILGKAPFMKTFIGLGLLEIYTKKQVNIPHCYTSLRAPKGCSQYYTGLTGVIKNFNYDGTSKFPSNLDYTICIRAPHNTCRATLSSFEFSIPAWDAGCVNGEQSVAIPASDAGCVNGTDSVCPGMPCCTKGFKKDSDGAFEKYLGFDGKVYDEKKYDHHNKNGGYKKSHPRYFFCGRSLGATGFTFSDNNGPIVMKVFSDEKVADSSFVGFKIGYNVEVGSC